MKKINIGRINTFFSHDIWQVKIDSFPKWQRGPVKLLRIILMSVQDYTIKQLNLRAASLTLFSLLSIVPVIAMIFGIAKGFGLEAYIEKELTAYFANQPLILNNLLHYVRNMLSEAKGGVIAGFGFVLLLWSVIQVLSSIENSFNSIWYVKHARTWARKFTDYLSIMMLAPLFIVLSGFVNVFIATQLQSFADEMMMFGKLISTLTVYAIQLLPYLSTSLLFFIIYMVMPNTRVKPKAAWYAGIVAGIAFQLFEWGYIEFQVGVSRHNAIYGSFASIPLFITWLQISWMIVLVGAEISYSVQNVSNFESMQRTNRLSVAQRLAYSVYILRYLCKKFAKAEQAPDLHEISTSLDIPSGIAKTLINEMMEAGLIASHLKQNNTYYFPAIDLKYLTLVYVVQTLQHHHADANNHIPSTDFEAVRMALAQLTEQAAASDANKSILEL